MAHEYLFTGPIEGVTPALPQLRDPDNLVYFREEVGGLCMGGYERSPAPWGLDGIPADFNHRLLDPDWPRFEEIMAGAIRRVPAMADAPVMRMIDGPEGFTPDNEFILGESEVRGLFVAAGFCAQRVRRPVSAVAACVRLATISALVVAAPARDETGRIPTLLVFAVSSTARWFTRTCADRRVCTSGTTTPNVIRRVIPYSSANGVVTIRASLRTSSRPSVNR
jgi:hypothetical protein